MALDGDLRVRCAVAEHPCCPPARLEEMAGDGALRVRLSVAASAACSAAVLDRLASDAEVAVRRLAAGNPRCAPGRLERLTDDADLLVMATAAGNPSCPAARLEQMARHAEIFVRRMVAGNLACPLPVLQQGDVTRALQDCRAAGKLRVAAYSGDNAEADFAVASGAFGGLQTSISLCDQAHLRMRAARADRLQTSLNLALGSALASIGLTIPVVAVVSLTMGWPLALGIDAKAMVLLVLTLLVTTLSLGTGRTTVLQGVVHLVIFAVYLFTTIVP